MTAEPPTLTARLEDLVRVYGPCPVHLLAVALQLPEDAVWTLAEPLVAAGVLARTADDALAVKR